MEGGGGGSHEVVGKHSVKIENSQMTSIDATFNSTYHTKQLNPWPILLSNYVVIYSQLSTCLGEMKPFRDHLSTYIWTFETSFRSNPQSSLGNIQHQYLPKLLCVHLLCDGEKCLAVVCIEVDFSQIQSYM